jgi:hypothetical protein
VSPIGVTRPVCHGGGRGGGFVLQMETSVGFRRGAGGRCVGTNESMGSVWLEKCPYLFAQGTYSNT